MKGSSCIARRKYAFRRGILQGLEEGCQDTGFLECARGPHALPRLLALDLMELGACRLLEEELKALSITAGWLEMNRRGVLR